jgi:hypothetical protein
MQACAKKNPKRLFMSLAVFWLVTASGLVTGAEIQPSHGIPYPDGWKDWAVISVCHRTDNQTLRVIVGNDIALKAARSGNIYPWPDGTILGKIVWRESRSKSWEEAWVAGGFVHAEFMFKNAEKYRNSRGWGWARWVGKEQQPYMQGMQVCIDCHTPVQDRDWVFTEPAPFPP